MTRLLAAVSALAVLVGLGVGTPASTAATERAGAVRVDWLSGLSVHYPGGPALHVPLPRSHAATLHLLGPVSGGGYVFVDEQDTRKVLLVLRNDRLRRFRTVDDPQDGASFLLAPDGRSVVEMDAPTTVRTDLWTYDLTGGHLEHRRVPRPVELLAYDGETVWFATSQRTFAWHPAAGITDVADTGAVAADPAHDVLWPIDLDSGTVGPTSLTSPGALSWTLPSSSFFPRTISSDGAYVAGLTGNRNRVQVRRMSDGSLVSEWKLHLVFTRPLVWDGDRSDRLVSVLRTRRGQALVRCEVGAECARATPLYDDPISLPFQVTRPASF